MPAATAARSPSRTWPAESPHLVREAHFGRILAAYGGVFVAGSLAWGVVVDGFRPDRFDIAGALICVVGVAVIMYAPRSA